MLLAMGQKRLQSSADTHREGHGETVSFYARHVVPRLVELAMRNKDATRLREAWIPQARGEVLEVGIGSGLNLPFYSAAVQHIYGVDPSIELQQIARKRLADTQLRVDFLTQSAEEPLPLPDQSIDTVVSTWTLCSVPDALPALKEMRRVLKPSGSVIFLEHGRSDDARADDGDAALAHLNSSSSPGSVI